MTTKVDFTNADRTYTPAEKCWRSRFSKLFKASDRTSLTLVENLMASYVASQEERVRDLELIEAYATWSATPDEEPEYQDDSEIELIAFDDSMLGSDDDIACDLVDSDHEYSADAAEITDDPAAEITAEISHQVTAADNQLWEIIDKFEQSLPGRRTQSFGVVLEMCADVIAEWAPFELCQLNRHFNDVVMRRMPKVSMHCVELDDRAQVTLQIQCKNTHRRGCDCMSYVHIRRCQGLRREVGKWDMVSSLHELTTSDEMFWFSLMHSEAHPSCSEINLGTAMSLGIISADVCNRISYAEDSRRWLKITRTDGSAPKYCTPRRWHVAVGGPTRLQFEKNMTVCGTQDDFIGCLSSHFLSEFPAADSDLFERCSYRVGWIAADFRVLKPSAMRVALECYIAIFG